MFTYDVTTDAGKVRLLTADTDATSYDFEDDEIDAALSMSNNSIHMAAADLLESLASNRARLALKKERGDMKEDLTKIAQELRASAQRFRERAREIATDEASTILEATSTPNWLKRDEDAEEPGWWTYLCDRVV